MSDPIVTHADRQGLRDLREKAWVLAPGSVPLLDRLIAAAKADAPPLPEGWVLAEDGGGARRVLWHQDGTLWTYADGSVGGYIFTDFKSVTPLRPTITETDVDRATEAAWRAHGHYETAAHRRWRPVAAAVFDSAGIEVQP